jgi:sulfur carrier protein ThiS
MTTTELAIPAGGKAVLLTGMFGAPEREIALARPMAIAEVIAAHELEFRLPTIAVLNGEPVLRGQWAVRYVLETDVIAFVAVPGGGGGGGGSNSGKQIMGLVAALALSVAAPFVGSFLAGSLGFAAGTMGFSIASSLASAAFLAGGALLLNMLMPPPTSTASGSLGTADPVYSVNATSNQATPLERLPVLYGRLRFPPRHASRPYSEYVGNDQYLYQLFLVTAGKADITKIEIGETEAWNAVDGYSTSFSDLEFQIIQPGGSITLFPANVVTAPEVSNQSVPNPPSVLGPFVVNSAGTTIDRIAVDFAFPGGLYTIDGSTVATNSIALRAQYREIDNDGAPVGTAVWTNIFVETISAATRTPQRMSRSTPVAAGRYEVRFLADEAFDPDDGSAINAVVWTGLRGYLTDFVTPANCTLLAMKIRANEQLSQFSSNQIRVTAERYLPVWNGTSWVETKTRSIAWAAADLLMNSDYSIGLTTGQFDLAGLTTLAATWAGRNDTFNAIFDREWTVQDALRAVLRAGRTQAVRMGGRIGFVRLEPKLIKRAVFTPRNVVRGSFQHKIVLFDEEKPDSVLGSYIDETTWQEEEVLASLASVGSDAPQAVEWFGITDHDQAWRESVTEAAVNAFAREFVSFTAEWEGKLLVRGEPILVQHPFIEGVESAAIADRLVDVITIDRDLTQEISGDAYVIIRGKDGKEWGPCLVDTIDGRVITLDATDRATVVAGMGALSSILPDDREESAHILICDGEMRPFNGLVASAAPNSSGKVDILAVIDAPEVYLADATEVIPSPWTPPVLPPQNPARPLLLGLYAELRAGIAQLELDAMWQPTPGAIGGYVAEVSYDDDSIPDAEKTWTPVWSGFTNRFTVPVLPQALVLRVAAVGILQGAWSKRVFVLGEVPTIVVPGEYLDLDDAFAAASAAIVEDLKWISNSVRSAIENFERLGTTLAEQDLANFNDREALKRELRKTTGELEASFTEIIEVALGPGGAIATSLASLYAAMGGNSSQVNVRWQAQAGPIGYAARYAITAEVNDGDIRSASFFLDVPTNPAEPTRIVLDADQTVISTDGGSTVVALFDSNGAIIRDLKVGTIVGPGGASYWNLSTGAFRIST